MTDVPIRSLWCRATSGANDRGVKPVLYIRFTGDPETAIDDDSLAEVGEAHFNHPDGVPNVEIDIYIYWDTYVGSSGLTCQGRVDDSTAVSYRLSPSTSNTSTFFQLNPLEEARLFRKLLEGSQFTVRFTPYGENPITSVFSLSGLTSAAISEGIDVTPYLELQDSMEEEQSDSYLQNTGAVGHRVEGDASPEDSADETPHIGRQLN